ncbi:MAG: hypothetical protein DRR06_08875 [Gammaproteobacteria bacterium]|nr:MAG: hypothetical protein DRR06_08875 [Gammaproteobacteria bacterium]RLA51902.1 MAG: hypothetical protein DRR42_09015 [Gammaproteobacteria bacterium]
MARRTIIQIALRVCVITEREGKRGQNLIISFQIKHPKENLEAAAKKLATSPFRIWGVGCQRQTPKGKKLDGVYNYSYCCLRLENKEELCGSDLIAELLDALESDRKYWSDLVLSGGGFSLVVFSEKNKSSYVEEFDWQLLDRLSNLRISLGFDV